MTWSNHLFHYTNASAIIQIVCQRKLWATHIDYLNDKREGAVAKNHLKFMLDGFDGYIQDVCDHFLRSSKHSYIVAFSPRYDNLSLYRTYGPSHGGYCVGFNQSYLSGIPSVDLITCEYSEKTQQDAVRTLLTEMVPVIREYKDKGTSPENAIVQLQRNHDFFDRLAGLSESFKSPEFSTEEEARLVSRAWSERMLRVSPLGHVMIPYVEVELPNEETDVLIVLGPNTNFEIAMRGIQEIHHVAERNGCRWNIHVGIWELSGFRTL